MANTGPEKQRANYEEDLPVVLLHGTSGPSEELSQVVEQLRWHRPVIRLNCAEPVIGIDSKMHLQYPMLQIELWQQRGLVAGIPLTL